ncbi:MAG: response regulator [Candidatus Sericytochromatia bacterium]
MLAPPLPQHILIIEDSQTLGRVALDKFSQSPLPYQPIWVSSFAETRAAVESGKYQFVWALVDLTLPDASGDEVIDYLSFQRIRPIVLTGTFGEEWRELLLAKNVVDYFIKNSLNDYDLIIDQIERLDRNQDITILVVDDSISYRAYLSRLLRIRNYRLLEASHAAEALEKLQAHPEIRLVITDYMMPDMNGIELTRQIRKKHKPNQVAIIGVSASDDLVLSARFLKAGASDYLRKPFSIEEFNCRVSQNIHQMHQFDVIQKNLDMKNYLLGMAAHDIRNPLGNIHGFCLLFQRGAIGDLSEEQRHVIEQIKGVTQYTLQMLNDLLDISAIEQGSLRLNPFDISLAALVRERAGTYRLYAQEKKIQLILELDEMPPIPCDMRRFSQVIDNLLSNAIKYSFPDSRVWVRYRYLEGEPVLEFSDEGQGISADDQERLFRPFERLRSTPTGGESSTGLGLVIVRKIVEAHGWAIRCHSVLGQGTTFQVALSPVLASVA